MHIVIIGDAFPPMKTSGAVMLKDLADEFIAQGDTVDVIIPNQSQDDFVIENIQNGLNLIQVKAFGTKDVSYFKRLFAELINPYLMWARLCRLGAFQKDPVNLVIWYSPSIFWGPLVGRIKKQWECPAYLVLRDIFPDWAIHLGLISQYNPITFFLKLIANFQYGQADFIGVQSPNNRTYLINSHPLLAPKVKVLWNWVRNEATQEKCSIRVSETALAGKMVFVYAGNIGIAQGSEIFLRIISAFQDNIHVGFLFVGRGSGVLELQKKVLESHFKNVLFYSEIPPEQINDLYSQCHAGIIALDRLHKTHNIPGKFVSYMQAGLPVFGLVNSGNDLIDMVNMFKLGFIGDASNTENLSKMATSFIEQDLADANIRQRCQKLASNLFDSKKAVAVIKSSFT